MSALYGESGRQQIVLMFDRDLFLSLRAIRQQLAAMPRDLYLVRLIHHTTRTAFPGERLWTAAQLGRMCCNFGSGRLVG